MKIFKNKKGIGGFLVFIALLIIVATVFVLFGKNFNLTKDIHTKLLGDRFSWDFDFFDKEKDIDTVRFEESNLIVPPDGVSDWCRIQNMRVDEGRESPISNSIIGYDNINEACVIKYFGYSCSLQKEVTVIYGYTGVVGGKIVYVMTDGMYVNISRYNEYVEDLDKLRIENKPCISGLYGGVSI